MITNKVKRLREHINEISLSAQMAKHRSDAESVPNQNNVSAKSSHYHGHLNPDKFPDKKNPRPKFRVDVQIFRKEKHGNAFETIEKHTHHTIYAVDKQEAINKTKEHYINLFAQSTDAEYKASKLGSVKAIDILGAK